jgi:hypothetical protein
VHRQTNRHSREISEIVPEHTRARAHAEIIHTPLRCGGDECDADSLSLLIYTHIHRHTSMHVCLLAFVRMPDRWLPNSDSLSLRSSYNHSYQHAYLCVCVRIYLFFFFFLSRRWLPNALFLLNTGRFICTTTSCRPCHPAFLPGFPRLGECVCFSWLSTEIMCLSESFDFLSLLDMYLPVF